MKKVLTVILFLSVLLFVMSCTEVTAPADSVVADAGELYPAAPPMPGEESGDIVGRATQALVNDPTVCNEYAVVEKGLGTSPTSNCAPKYGNLNASNLVAVFPPSYTVSPHEHRNIMRVNLTNDRNINTYNYLHYNYVYKYGWVFKNRQWQRFEWDNNFGRTYQSDYPNEIFVGASTTTPGDWLALGNSSLTSSLPTRFLTHSIIFNSDDAQKPNADNTTFLPFDFTDVNTDEGTAFVTAFICGCDGDSCRRQSGWHCNLHTDPSAPGAVQGPNGLQMNGFWTITGSDLQEVNVVGAGPGDLGSAPSGGTGAGSGGAYLAYGSSNEIYLVDLNQGVTPVTIGSVSQFSSFDYARLSMDDEYVVWSEDVGTNLGQMHAYKISSATNFNQSYTRSNYLTGRLGNYSISNQKIVLGDSAGGIQFFDPEGTLNYGVIIPGSPLVDMKGPLSISGVYIVWRDGRHDVGCLSDRGDCDIYLYNTNTLQEIRLTSSTTAVGNPIIDGSNVLWSDGGLQLYRIDTGVHIEVLGPQQGWRSRDVSQHHVVWATDAGVYLYDIRDGTTMNITASCNPNSETVIVVRVSGDRVACALGPLYGVAHSITVYNMNTNTSVDIQVSPFNAKAIQLYSGTAPN
jgi:hypothetical protein